MSHSLWISGGSFVSAERWLASLKKTGFRFELENEEAFEGEPEDDPVFAEWNQLPPA